MGESWLNEATGLNFIAIDAASHCSRLSSVVGPSEAAGNVPAGAGGGGERPTQNSDERSRVGETDPGSSAQSDGKRTNMDGRTD